MFSSLPVYSIPLSYVFIRKGASCRDTLYASFKTRSNIVVLIQHFNWASSFSAIPCDVNEYTASVSGTSMLSIRC